jgi:hypothetical protein
MDVAVTKAFTVHMIYHTVRIKAKLCVLQDTEVQPPSDLCILTVINLSCGPYFMHLVALHLEQSAISC